MKNTIYILALICIFASSCVMRNGKVERISFNDPEIETMEDVNTQRELLADGKRAPITLLINAYNNGNLNYDVRMASLEALAESKDPLVIEAIQKSIRNAELIDLDMMIKSISLLAKYGDSESIGALTSALKKSESKIMDLREVIVTAIGENGSDDHIITLLELYEISRINHQKNSQLLAIALGDMGDDRAIPVLMEIAQNKEHDLITRKLAVDILAKKEATELVDYFIELLGDPHTRQSMNDFALEVMGDLDNQQMILALLESYQIGKQQYYSMLIRLMDIMSEQNNVQLKPVIIEVALTEHLPYHIRIKAIKSLANFGDPSVIDKIIILLNESKNYIFYEHIVELILSMDVMPEYESQLREASFKAMNNQKELEE